MAWPRHWRLSLGRLRHGWVRLVANATSESGFTLVEVIVALAILSIGLSVLLGSIAASLRQTANAARMAEASTLAQSLMAEVGTDLPLKEEDRVGEFPNGYRWHLQMQPYGNAMESEEWPVGAYPYLVSTAVEWEEGQTDVLTHLRHCVSGRRQNGNDGRSGGSWAQ
jgi:general secretion pathway protein I